jgi:hypothetical protein
VSVVLADVDRAAAAKLIVVSDPLGHVDDLLGLAGLARSLGPGGGVCVLCMFVSVVNVASWRGSCRYVS